MNVNLAAQKKAICRQKNDGREEKQRDVCTAIIKMDPNFVAGSV
jgi:hypothetical protein